MKYIITESKLNNIIFKYLDMKYGALEPKRGEYSDIIFAFPDEEYGKLGWEKSGNLYVFNKLRDEISNYFGMDNNDSLRVISKWVEDRYNLKVINTSKKWIHSNHKKLNNLKVINTIQTAPSSASVLKINTI